MAHSEHRRRSLLDLLRPARSLALLGAALFLLAQPALVPGRPPATGVGSCLAGLDEAQAQEERSSAQVWSDVAPVPLEGIAERLDASTDEEAAEGDPTQAKHSARGLVRGVKLVALTERDEARVLPSVWQPHCPTRAPPRA